MLTAADMITSRISREGLAASVDLHELRASPPVLQGCLGERGITLSSSLCFTLKFSRMIRDFTLNQCDLDGQSESVL